MEKVFGGLKWTPELVLSDTIVEARIQCDPEPRREVHLSGTGLPT